MAQLVKNPPAAQETWFDPWVGKSPLEKGKATHSGILAWENAMDRGDWWAIVHGVTDEQLSLFLGL